MQQLAISTQVSYCNSCTCFQQLPAPLAEGLSHQIALSFLVTFLKAFLERALYGGEMSPHRKHTPAGSTKAEP
jgi:hypothetical protein